MSPRKSHPTPGASPGTLSPPTQSSSTRIRAHDFDADRLDVLEVDAASDLIAYRDAPTVTWVELTGLKDTARLQEVARVFELHPLLLEDAVNVPVRPKCEAFGSQQLVVLQMVRIGKRENVQRCQITIFFGKNFVLTVSEKDWDIFSPVQQRLREGTRIRQRGTDYFSYALIDTVVDSYFPYLEKLAERVDALEAQISTSPHHDQVHSIVRQRKHLQALRRHLWPTRDVLRSLIRDETDLIEDSTLVYLRDCSDHVEQALDLTDSLIESTSQLASLHASHMNDSLNQTMKTLTIISSIFIPLSFLAGVYGMNFEWMPELRWKWGYPAVLGMMAAVAMGLVLLFRRRGWIGRR